MAHSNNKISYIQLPGSNIQYEIHDEQAIHDISDLGLSKAFVFKGSKPTYADLLLETDKRTGDVWHVEENDGEYVYTDDGEWEDFGPTHPYADENHTHNVTVTGTNEASTVTGTVTVPDVSKTTKKMGASATQGAVTAPTDNVIGADTTHNTAVELNTTKLKATASGVTVGANGTASVVTGYASPSTDTALGTGATFKVTGGAATTSKMVTSTASKVTVSDLKASKISGNTSVKASKVSSTGSVEAGTAPSWTASVSNGVLTIGWAAGTTPPNVTVPTFTEVTATNTTYSDVDVSKTSASDVTVATGSLSSTGTGSAVATSVGAISVAVDSADTVTALTGLGDASTATVLTGVKVNAQPTVTIAAGTTGDVTVATSVKTATVTHNTNDTVAAVTSVSVANPTVTLNGNASTGVTYVDGVTIGTKSASLTNGSAAAQKWTQASGSTGKPTDAPQ